MKNQLKKQIRVANNARSQYNPLRGMSLQRAVRLLEEGERGLYADLQWLYRMIEKRDAVVRALKRRRSAALLKLEWNIKTIPPDQMPDGITDQQAEAQAKELRKLYEQIDNVYDAIKAMALAEFRGYAHFEKVYRNNRPAPDAITRLEPIDQWYWIRDGYNGPWRFNPDLLSSLHSAEEVDTEHLVIREVDDPIDEIALIAFLRKNMSQKDWDGFVEVFGIPDIFFEMPQGISEDKMKEWLDQTERLAGDGQGGLPSGTKVQTVGGDVRGVNPFEGHIKYQDSCVVLAGTGGKLTMLNDPTGLGDGAADAHEQAFDDLAAEEARVISEIFQRSIDIPLLKDRFPDQPILAYFDLNAQTEENVTEIISHIKGLYDAGYTIDPEEVTERTGYHVTPKPADPQPAEPRVTASEVKNRRWPFRLFNRRPEKDDPGEETQKTLATLSKNARNALALAVEADQMPVADRLREILDDDSLTDDGFFQALETFQTDELPELAKRILDNPSLADAVADTLSAGLFNGAADAVESRNVESPTS